MATAKQKTTKAFGLTVEVEQLGRGAIAKVKEPNHFLNGVYKFASTMRMAEELLKDEICKELAIHVCREITKR